MDSLTLTDESTILRFHCKLFEWNLDIVDLEILDFLSTDKSFLTILYWVKWELSQGLIEIIFNFIWCPIRIPCSIDLKRYKVNSWSRIYVFSSFPVAQVVAFLNPTSTDPVLVAANVVTPLGTGELWNILSLPAISRVGQLGWFVSQAGQPES